ncbi:helix-turn-helix domain-containing protein [Pseudalkalibacillus caeni]|uniref:Helix-turn-helix transcriptional regulator n=1 Tax=Exobacillus caeni TaxID=2574798 RepID=A0A5R9F9B8_9BACL|nr:helix-turn-helix domain-containing protein [Pseudalkalibacillus caeni]TLS37453.1 helix-turn-helix transcriptional regulator [Pseudalkalibacillus caeni]
MEHVKVGKSIRELRSFLGISQSELANGICTQSLISQIENDQVSPTADILYKIASRLGVDINYFFDMTDCPRLDYVQEVFFQIRKNIKQREYNMVAEIIKAEEKNPLFHSRKNKQFFQWHKGICAYYLKHDKALSLALLNESLELTATTGKNFSEREIEILISIGIIHAEEKEYKQAAVYFKRGFYHVRFFPIIKNPLIEIRLYYNYSKLLTLMNSYEKSIFIAKEGMLLCSTRQVWYLYGELCYQTGKNLIKMNRFEDSLLYLKKALAIFELEGNELFTNHVRKVISKYNTEPSYVI